MLYGIAQVEYTGRLDRLGANGCKVYHDALKDVVSTVDWGHVILWPTFSPHIIFSIFDTVLKWFWDLFSTLCPHPPQIWSKSQQRVSPWPAGSRGSWKVPALRPCSLTVLMINWGAIVSGQLSAVYPTLCPSCSVAFFMCSTDSCPSHSCENELLFSEPIMLGATYRLLYSNLIQTLVQSSSFGVSMEGSIPVKAYVE